MSEGFGGIEFDSRIIEGFALEREWDFIDTVVMIRDVTARVKAK